RANGVDAIVITDTLRSPLVPGAVVAFSIATATPHFFPSILSAITLIEAILAECVAYGPEALVDNVARFDSRMRDMGAYVENEKEIREKRKGEKKKGEEEKTVASSGRKAPGARLNIRVSG